jgi:hypothetical protein
MGWTELERGCDGAADAGSERLATATAPGGPGVDIALGAGSIPAAVLLARVWLGFLRLSAVEVAAGGFLSEWKGE